MNWGVFWPGFIFGMLLSFSVGLLLQRRRRGVGYTGKVFLLCLVALLSAFGLVQLLWSVFGDKT